ncbi:hypothetical protein ACFQ60_28300 [Streptomyces zhihengii]|uniref:Uncharacterized protein n=1 Tax=Streptomyces zhihengii TaxID=1818004 RepID=A0ABS2URY0_9ACTN|nr:hypothetical protein [Streptomyces zhihengii]MBM9620053.1 hypothetical protein [Streptomyces zhihengii]
MSPAVRGPALFIGGDTDYVALVRPALDPADPDVRRAAEQAGVGPEEFAGAGDTWAVLLDSGGEGDGFELPGVRDTEPAGFAERLRDALAGPAAGPFEVDGGAVLRLDARPAGEGSYAFTAHITPPGDDAVPVAVETGPLPVDGLLADLDAFLGSLA